MLFKDAGSGQPIADVFVEWRTDGKNGFAITDHSGAVEIPGINEKELYFFASHINYEPKADTLPPGRRQVFLVPGGYDLKEVVVTGQFSPRSAERSVYVVQTIGREEIESHHGRDLSDLFFHQLNFRPSNDVRQGLTSFSLQGISGNNLLILLDGVPINGRTSDDFDFGQVDPGNIERIEIVKGPMSVLYGSNAMAGVINLLTRSDRDTSFALRASLLAETVDNKFGWEAGIQQISLHPSFGFSEIPLQLSASLSKKFFHGHKGQTNQRSMLWKPKEQWHASWAVNYRPKKWNIRFRTDFMNELISAPGEPIGIVRPIALDDYFRAKRFIHQLQINRSIPGFGSVESLMALTDYRRKKEQWAVNLNAGTRQLSTADGGQDKTSLIGFQNRSAVNMLTGSELSLQLGYDYEYQKIEGGRLIDEQSRDLHEISVFAAAEYRMMDGLKIRPGLRLTYNSLHSSPVVPSLNAMYSFDGGLDLRMAYGRGYRAPSTREMYFEFFDSNHKIIGNEDLKAEKGHHFTTSLSGNASIVSQSDLNWSVQLFYNSISDQITYGRSVRDPQITTLINQSKFKSWGVALDGTFSFGQLDIRPGLALSGSNNILSEETEDMGYLYTPEFGVALRYDMRPGPWKMAINYRFFGKQPVYGIDVEDVSQEVQLSSIDSFHWLDFNASRVIIEGLDVSLGVRNALNVTDINSTPAVGTIHPSGERDYISFGRSFFVKINYSFK